MDFEQYIGCLIRYHGSIAIVEGAGSNYNGDWFRLRYLDEKDSFETDAFDGELMDALPDPEYGILKYRGEEVVFLFRETEYVLVAHPYEPCLYIKKDGEIFRTLHNAFEAAGLPERFARGETLTGIDGREYGRESFVRVLAAAVSSCRSEMDFTFAAVLARTETERFDDFQPDCAPKEALYAAQRKQTVMNFCPKCGTRNNGGNYCTECGRKLMYETGRKE